MSNKPIFKIKDGAIKATCWKNDSAKGSFYSVDVVRSYKNDNGDWKETANFSGTEILRVANLYQSAYNRIIRLKADNSEAEKGGAQ